MLHLESGFYHRIYEEHNMKYIIFVILLTNHLTYFRFNTAQNKICCGTLIQRSLTKISLIQYNSNLQIF